MTHASPEVEKFRSRLIDGSATFTIVWSRMIIKKPVHSTISASQRLRSDSLGAVGSGV